MDLYLLRHAAAGEAPRDADRELTERGHQQARAVAAGIAWLDPGLDAILTSPLPRAAQTAQPVAKALGLRLETVDALAPGHDPAEALDPRPEFAVEHTDMGHHAFVGVEI